MKLATESVVSCLTPAGTGAIATIAVRGPMAWHALRQLFQPALPETLPADGTVWFGRLGDSGIADEVLLTLKQWDPAPWLEIHSHGGRQVVAWLLECFERRGLKQLSWNQFHDEVEAPARAAALECLARTTTARTAALLLDQVNGAYQNAIEATRGNWDAGRVEQVRQQIDDLLMFAALGRHLVDPWRVVVAGAPNVGKSSLVNALAGFQRSVVAPVPGTTRDMVSTRLAIDGWPVELLDTAGLHSDSGGLERAGIDLARAAIEAADLCIWVVDATVPPVWPDKLSVGPVMAVNKCDLAPAWPADESVLKVSALTGAGINSLVQVISRRLVPEPPSRVAGIPFLASQIELLGKLRMAVQVSDGALAAELLSALAG